MTKDTILEAFDPRTLTSESLASLAERTKLMCSLRRQYRTSAEDGYTTLLDLLAPYNDTSLMRMIHSYDPDQTVADAMIEDSAVILTNALDTVTDPGLRRSIDEALQVLKKNGVVICC